MPNDDLISKKKLLEDFEWLRSQVSECSRSEIDSYIERIKNTPAVDAVEVVRCKDCKFSKPLENIPSHRYCIALKDVINFGDNFFCARGVKMDKEV